MLTSDRDIRRARALLDDALQVSDVLPKNGQGDQIKSDIELALILLDPGSTDAHVACMAFAAQCGDVVIRPDAQKDEALESAKVVVHPSNVRKLI